MLNINKSDK